MKKTLFVVSHLFSGSDYLVRVMNNNSRIQMWNTGVMYQHPTDLEHLHSMPHKLLTSAAIYGDHLLYNTSFCNKIFYKYEFCSFIYVVRSARGTLNSLITHGKYDLDTLTMAMRYYTYRLRRIYEMAKETPGAVLLTYENILGNEGSYLINGYLDLDSPLESLDGLGKEIDELDLMDIESAQNSYERHLYNFKQLNLRMI